MRFSNGLQYPNLANNRIATHYHRLRLNRRPHHSFIHRHKIVIYVNSYQPYAAQLLRCGVHTWASVCVPLKYTARLMSLHCLAANLLQLFSVERRKKKARSTQFMAWSMYKIDSPLKSSSILWKCPCRRWQPNGGEITFAHKGKFHLIHIDCTFMRS